MTWGGTRPRHGAGKWTRSPGHRARAPPRSVLPQPNASEADAARARRDVRPESATGSLKERPRFSPGPCGSGGPTSAQRRQRPRPPPQGGSDLQVTRGSTPPTTAPGDPSAEVGLAGSLAFLSPRAPGGPCGQEGDSDRLGTPPWPAVLHGEQEGPAHQAVPPSTATTSSRTSASTASL